MKNPLISALNLGILAILFATSGGAFAECYVVYPAPRAVSCNYQYVASYTISERHDSGSYSITAYDLAPTCCTYSSCEYTRCSPCMNTCGVIEEETWTYNQDQRTDDDGAADMDIDS